MVFRSSGTRALVAALAVVVVAVVVRARRTEDEAPTRERAHPRTAAGGTRPARHGSRAVGGGRAATSTGARAIASAATGHGAMPSSLTPEQLGEYAFDIDEGGTSAAFVSRSEAIRGSIRADGTVELEHHGAEVTAFSTRATRLHRDEITVAALGEAELRPGACAGPERLDAGGHCLARLESARAEGVREWFENTARGLEQGWELTERTGGEAPLRLEVKVERAIVLPEEGERPTSLVFFASGKRAAAFGHLLVRDANGASVPSWFEARAGGFDVVVDDADAAYPLVVDPLYSSPVTTITSTAAARVVGTAGDVNGDGFDDVIVSRPYGTNGNTNEGIVYIFHGSATGLTTPAAQRVEGNASYREFGNGAAGVGDVNGDGFDDVVIGSPNYTNGNTNEGRYELYLGSASGIGTTATTAFEPNLNSALCGMVIAPVGDVNADGYSDVVVGCPLAVTADGRAYVHYGSASGLGPSAVTMTGGTGSARLGYTVIGAGDINSDGFDDVALTGDSTYSNIHLHYGSATGLLATESRVLHAATSNTGFGTALAAGDIDGDGLADLLVGEGSGGGGDQGQVSFYRGTASGLAANPTVRFAGSSADEGFGISLATLGDVDGDGFADVAVAREGGACCSVSAPASTESSGATFDVLQGSAGTVAAPMFTGGRAVRGWIDVPMNGFAAAGDVNGDGYSDVVSLDDVALTVVVRYGGAGLPSSTLSQTIPTDTLADNFGLQQSVNGDVNGDGFDDLVIGDPTYDNSSLTDRGAIWVYLGSASGVSTPAVAKIEGASAALRFGEALASAGDVNGDGFDDVVVGSDEDDTAFNNAGRIWLFQGTATGLATTADFTATGESLASGFGRTVDGAGDVNGDGYADVIVGAPGHELGQNNEGIAYIYFGSSSGLTTTRLPLEMNQASAAFGSTVRGAGDVNGDGYADVIVSAPYWDNGQSNEGRVYVFTGWNSVFSMANYVFREGVPGTNGFTSAEFGMHIAAVGDVDGDGFSDVMAGTGTNGYVAIYRGSATGTNFALATTLTVPTSSFTSLGSAGDVNADGRGDVHISESLNSTTQVYLGTAGGLSPTSSFTFSSSGTPRSAGGGDIDGDGYGDLVIGHPNESPDFVAVHYGSTEDDGSRPRAPRRLIALSTGGSATRQHWTAAASVGSYDVLATPDSVFGPLRARLEVESKPRGFLFDGTGVVTTAFAPVTQSSGAVRINLPAAYGSDYHHRFRVRYDGRHALPMNTSPWAYGGLSGESLGVHVRHPSLPNGTACTTASQCGSGRCVDGVCCNNACGGGVATDCQACSIAAGGSVDGACRTIALARAITCRASTGVCDPAEICSGSATTCPADARSAPTTVCRAAVDLCDAVEYCDGTNAVCPGDANEPTTTVCRTQSTAANAACDAAEYCTGTSKACPADIAAPSGTICRASAGICDLGESCDGSSMACPGNVLQPSGTVCRISAGACDVVEVCTGSSATCPTDVVRPGGTVCNAAVSGTCDLPDTCDGMSGVCPNLAKADGSACDDGLGCTSGDQCLAGSCQGARMPSGAVCRASAGSCDVPESCTGTSDVCPLDVVLTANTVCRAASGPCDLAEVCNGASGVCPGDAVQPANAVCRDSVGACDVAERCDGATAACPADAFAPPSTQCDVDTGAACDAPDFCTGTSATCPEQTDPDGTPCDDGQSCSTGDRCTAGSCGGTLAASGTVCRASGGACDVEESCDGVSAACPPDVTVPASTVCRPSAGACDAAEVCDGTTKVCPGDVVATSGTVCRPPVGGCDLAEVCNGVTNVCPPDVYAGAAVQCDFATDPCDAPDFCDGTTPVCPETFAADGTLCDDGSICSSSDQCAAGVCTGIAMPAGAVCRVAAGACDVPESCDGVNGACPPDDKVAADTVCRSSIGACDVAEVCDGASAACPGDAIQPSGAVCRPSTGACDVAETCSGATPACPVDAFQPATTMCNAANGTCDVNDFCSGVDATCVPTFAADGTSCDDGASCTGTDVCAAGTCRGTRLTAGTVCRPQAGSCDVAESCDGISDDCPTDALRSANAVCRASTSPCDLAERCDGASPTCPANGVQPAGILCRPAVNVCDVDETCDGTSAACPTDAFAPATVQCGTATGPCDANDFCSGTAATCDQSFADDGTPCDDAADCTTADACFVGVCRGTRLPAGTECRAAVGACDVAEACTGASDTCPADAVAAANTVCRGSAGACDLEEVCDGTDATCPGDVVQSSGVPCRAPVNVCDVGEACDGLRAACPFDQFAPATTVCNPAAIGDACDADDHCSGVDSSCLAEVAPDGTACDDGAGCTTNDTCAVGTCGGDLLGAGVPCRLPAGGCDAEERCDGIDPACPPDVVLAANTVCRGAQGECDFEEVCDGATSVCPGDVVQIAGYLCRPATSACDVDEVCDGSNVGCPVDGFQPATTVCNPAVATDPCDADDTCTGVDATCTPAFAPDGTSCDDAAGCTANDACAAGACAGSLVGAGVTCRPVSGACDTPESCDGVDPTCPADVVQPVNTVCRGAAGTCDVVEVCDGFAANCPGDQLLASGTECRGLAGTCDVVETCTGASPACPSDIVLPASTVCLASNNPCMQATSCDGTTGSCPTGSPVADGTPCDDGLTCTQASSCIAGTCAATVQIDCSDGDPCTTDLCVEPQGCTHAVIPACVPTDGGVDAGNGDATVGDAGGDGGTPPIARGGCSCGVAGGEDDRLALSLVAIGLVSVLTRRRRRH